MPIRDKALPREQRVTARDFSISSAKERADFVRCHEFGERLMAAALSGDKASLDNAEAGYSRFNARYETVRVHLDLTKLQETYPRLTATVDESNAVAADMESRTKILYPRVKSISELVPTTAGLEKQWKDPKPLSDEDKHIRALYANAHIPRLLLQGSYGW